MVSFMFRQAFRIIFPDSSLGWFWVFFGSTIKLFTHWVDDWHKKPQVNMTPFGKLLTSWNNIMQHLYSPHMTFKTPNSNLHLWNPFGKSPTLYSTQDKGENVHTLSKTHAHMHIRTSLSSCVIIKLFWTSHWKSNATCVSTRQMYCSCLLAPISSVIQPPFF